VQISGTKTNPVAIVLAKNDWSPVLGQKSPECFPQRSWHNLNEKVPKMLRNLSLLASCLLLSATLLAQSNPSGERGGLTVWAGAEISIFNPDYGCEDSSPFTCWNHQLLGIAPFVDANHLVFQRLGAEGEARFLPWKGPGNGLTQSNYLAGPRVGLLHVKNKFFFTGKFLFGLGHINTPNHSPGTGNYFVYAPGAVFDFKLSKRLIARVDYEYQLWPSFLGGGGLTPNGFSFGLSYALLK
jgi:hypothetical protein